MIGLIRVLLVHTFLYTLEHRMRIYSIHVKYRTHVSPINIIDLQFSSLRVTLLLRSLRRSNSYLFVCPSCHRTFEDCHRCLESCVTHMNRTPACKPSAEAGDNGLSPRLEKCFNCCGKDNCTAVCQSYFKPLCKPKLCMRVSVVHFIMIGSFSLHHLPQFSSPTKWNFLTENFYTALKVIDFCS